jgi:YidC/Oxa1 family membrane protein insertase
MMKGMTYFMPPLMFFGTAWLPAGLQWFFLVLSLGSVAQTQATLNPMIRRWAQLPPLPDPESLAAKSVEYQAPTPSTGIGGSVKEGVAAASKTFKETMGATEERTRWKKAQEYEDQRAEEERQRAFRRMEDVRRRRAERQQ